MRLLGILFTISLLLFISCKQHQTTHTYVVTKILDGEVFEAIDREGEVHTFKLAGIDCVDHTQFPDDPYFQQLAADTWTEMFILLHDMEITVQYDLYKKDPEGRHIVYAYLPDGSMVNETILKMGMAVAEDYLTNRKYLDHFKTLDDRARAEGVGNWMLYHKDQSFVEDPK